LKLLPPRLLADAAFSPFQLFAFRTHWDIVWGSNSQVKMDMSAENPFADLMDKAVKLKGAQQAQLRTQFDSWPQYFQHSMFMQESVSSVRGFPFPERIQAAEAMKAKGNEHYGNNNFDEAVAEYEKALAVFKYIENKDPGWKKKGIEDKDLCLIDHKCDDKEDQKRLDALKVTCYLNLAGGFVTSDLDEFVATYSNVVVLVLIHPSIQLRSLSSRILRLALRLVTTLWQ
jgi:hypothetical protein